MTANKQLSYANNAVLTASPEELTLMLYNGAIKFCNKAIMGIENGDLQGAHNSIIRVQDIIDEFQITLNKDYEVSAQLELLYDYLSRRLVQANAEKDISLLNEVNEFLRELRDTWKEAMGLAKVAKKKTS